MVVLALELGEQLLRRLAEHVDEHVQPAAVGHADHHVLARRLRRRGWISVVEQRDQRVAAFEREALLADVFGVQVALEAFGRGQLLENACLARRR